MILPINNYTGEDRLDELISGMHSVLITDVGRLSGLTIKSKITSIAYADKPISQIVAAHAVWTEWNWEKGERAFIASLKS